MINYYMCLLIFSQTNNRKSGIKEETWNKSSKKTRSPENLSNVINDVRLYNASILTEFLARDVLFNTWVWLTTQSLRERSNGHRSKIRENKLKTNIVVHFNLPEHSFEDLKIQILETVSSADCLATQELFWIKQLQTIYPFGLNDNVLGYGNVSMLGSQEAPHFDSFAPRRQRIHGHRKPLRLRRSPEFKTVRQFGNVIISQGGTSNLRAYLFGINLQQLKVDSSIMSYDQKRCFGIIKAILHRERPSITYISLDIYGFVHFFVVLLIVIYVFVVSCCAFKLLYF